MIPLAEIQPMMMLGCLQKIEKTAPDLSRRMKALCSHVFKYAMVTGRAARDPTYGLEAAMNEDITLLSLSMNFLSFNPVSKVMRAVSIGKPFLPFNSCS